jgi:hypothetical protein
MKNQDDGETIIGGSGCRATLVMANRRTVKKTMIIRMCISLLGGICITGIGLVLVGCGGWGPCGPASTIAYVGGVLSVLHVTFLCTWFPSLDAVFGMIHCDLAVAIVVPTIFWTLLILSMWTAIKIVTQHRKIKTKQTTQD